MMCADYVPHRQVCNRCIDVRNEVKAAGADPRAFDDDVGSKIGSSTSIAAVMQTRSRKVEIPSGLSLPLAFGMNTRLMGSGR
jgi:hypothetical protein